MVAGAAVSAFADGRNRAGTASAMSLCGRVNKTVIVDSRASTERGICGLSRFPFGGRPAAAVVARLEADRLPDAAAKMRKDVREFIRRLEAAGLTVESTPGHYRVLREGKPLRKQNGMPFTLPFSPDTIRWRRAAIAKLRKLGIDL